jgi:hypothetical protein
MGYKKGDDFQSPTYSPSYTQTFSRVPPYGFAGEAILAGLRYRAGTNFLKDTIVPHGSPPVPWPGPLPYHRIPAHAGHPRLPVSNA